MVAAKVSNLVVLSALKMAGVSAVWRVLRKVVESADELVACWVAWKVARKAAQMVYYLAE